MDQAQVNNHHIYFRGSPSGQTAQASNNWLNDHSRFHMAQKKLQALKRRWLNARHSLFIELTVITHYFYEPHILIEAKVNNQAGDSTKRFVTADRIQRLTTHTMRFPHLTQFLHSKFINLVARVQATDNSEGDPPKDDTKFQNDQVTCLLLIMANINYTNWTSFWLCFSLLGSLVNWNECEMNYYSHRIRYETLFGIRLYSSSAGDTHYAVST